MYVTIGADGQLSGGIIDRVLAEVNGDQLVATGPIPERIPVARAEAWAARGVTVRNWRK